MNATPAAPAIRRLPQSVEVVVPVHNEEQSLAPFVERLHRYLDESFPAAFRITIADSASTDGTSREAALLQQRLPAVRSVRLEQKGRGSALKWVWATSAADVVAYLDMDLAIGMEAFMPLVAPLLTGHSDLAVGVRRQHTTAGARSLLLHLALAARFTDAQCGFKAMRSEVARALLPHVQDDGWFFDTELLLLAERNGLRIHEVPVDWAGPGSGGAAGRSARADLRSLTRMVARTLSGGARVDLPVRRHPAALSGWRRPA